MRRIKTKTEQETVTFPYIATFERRIDATIQKEYWLNNTRIRHEILYKMMSEDLETYLDSGKWIYGRAHDYSLKFSVREGLLREDILQSFLLLHFTSLSKLKRVGSKWVGYHELTLFVFNRLYPNHQLRNVEAMIR
jgi:hypothetical protein